MGGSAGPRVGAWHPQSLTSACPCPAFLIYEMKLMIPASSPTSGLRSTWGNALGTYTAWRKSFHLLLTFSLPMKKVHLWFPRYLTACARPGPLHVPFSPSRTPFFHALPYFPAAVLKTAPLPKLAHPGSHVGSLCPLCVWDVFCYGTCKTVLLLLLP